MQTVEFDAVPELFSALFRRWLKEPPGSEPRHGVVVRPEDVPEPPPGPSRDVRQELCARLEEYQKRLGAPPEAFSAIAKLRDERALSVITGQQPNLLGGPLLVTYKAATAVMLARRLEARWGRPVVPVFWNHSDDADVEEIRRVHLIDRENRLQAVEADAAPARTEIAALDWRESLPRLLARCWELLPETQFSPEARKIYQPGVAEGPAVWFAGILTRVLGPHGLVVFEPRLGRTLWADVIEREVRGNGGIHEALAAEAGRLKGEGFEPPLDAETVATLFRVLDGRRRKIRRTAAGLEEAEGPGPRSVEETARLVREQPETFSPGVALRPICQDRVFPTAAIVGGPAEIGYLTQLRGAYAAFGMQPPALVPRLSATLLEPKIRKVLDKFRLSPPEVLHLGRRIGTLMEGALPPDLEERYYRLRHALVVEVRAMRKLTQEVDPSLERHYRRFAGKVMHSLKELKRRTAGVLLEREQVGRSQLEKAALHVTPRQQPQERVLTLAPYLCLFGSGVVGRLLEAADGFAGKHVLVGL